MIKNIITLGATLLGATQLLYCADFSRELPDKVQKGIHANLNSPAFMTEAIEQGSQREKISYIEAALRFHHAFQDFPEAQTAVIIALQALTMKLPLDRSLKDGIASGDMKLVHDAFGKLNYKLIKAVRTEDIKTVQERLSAVQKLLASGADVNIARGRKAGGSPLHYAASRGHAEVAKLLLDNGAYINAQDRNGATPLHKAARWNSIGVAQLLIERGADLSARNRYGKTPYDLAMQQGNAEVAALLKR